jgi:hypothetical protein
MGAAHTVPGMLTRFSIPVYHCCIARRTKSSRFSHAPTVMETCVSDGTSISLPMISFLMTSQSYLGDESRILDHPPRWSIFDCFCAWMYISVCMSSIYSCMLAMITKCLATQSKWKVLYGRRDMLVCICMGMVEARYEPKGNDFCPYFTILFAMRK